MALLIETDSVDHFVDRIQRITEGAVEVDKRSNTNYKHFKPKDSSCRSCGKQGHLQKECREREVTCFYCKNKGHRIAACPKLERKACNPPIPNRATTKATTTTTQAVAAIELKDIKDEIDINISFLTVNNINSVKCRLRVLVDTGSPTSFIKYEIATKYCVPWKQGLEPTEKKFRTVGNKSLELIRKVTFVDWV